MKRHPALVAFAVVVLLSCAEEANAQLFGQRDLGRSLSRRQSSSAQSSRASRSSSSFRQRQAQESPTRRLDTLFESMGSVEESRFYRGNREATAFVGADSREERGFVGSQQSTDLGGAPEITSAVDDFQLELAPDANVTAEPIVPARTGMYPPRLQVSFDFRPLPPGRVSTEVADRLVSVLSLDDSSSIEVSVEDGVAILRGEVASERDRRMAGLLVRLEPGIADSRNELMVKPPAAKAAPAPRAVEQ